MGYEFQSKRLLSKDLVAPLPLNRDLARAAGRLGGRLDAHNFSAGLKGSLSIAHDAYFSVDAVLVDRVNTNLPNVPDTSDPDVMLIPQDGAWHRIDGMQITVSTGLAVLWVYGWAQYIWHEFRVGVGGPPIPVEHSSGYWRKARVGFAIRVDGTIIDSTVTGHRSTRHWPFTPIRADAQRDATGDALPGPATPKVSQMVNGLGGEVANTRVGCMVPVMGGSHTVELLVRRLPPDDGSVPSSNDYIAVYDRTMFCASVPAYPSAVGSVDGVSIAPILPEDVLDQAALHTNRLEVIRSAYNAVKPGNVRLGGLNHAHLSGALIDHEIVTIAPSSAQSAGNIYIGSYDNTIAPGNTSSDSGWWPVQDGAGNRLDTRTTRPGGITTDVSANHWLLLLADLQVHSIGSTDLASPGNEEARIACFCLMREDTTTGARTVLIEGFVNHTGPTGISRDEYPLSMMYAFQPTPGNGYHYGLYTAMAYPTLPGLADNVSWQRGSLTAMVLRAP